MIDAAHQYLGDTGMWDGIIANCYQEIGFTVAGALVHQRVAISVPRQEAEAMNAVRRRVGKGN